MKGKILYTLLALMPVFSCVKRASHPTNLPSNGIDAIFGKWIWVYSSGGYTGSIQTPLRGHTFTSEFKTNGICVVADNGIENGYIGFHLFTKQTTDTGQRTYMIGYKQQATQSFTINNDTLVLVDQGNDGFAHVYSKYPSSKNAH